MWAYNVKAYFHQYYCGRVNVGDYLSWVPLVGGTLGALVGGFVSDRLARSKGFNGRLAVLVSSQVSPCVCAQLAGSNGAFHSPSASSLPLPAGGPPPPSHALGLPQPAAGLHHRGDVDRSVPGHGDQPGPCGHYLGRCGTLPVHHQQHRQLNDTPTPVPGREVGSWSCVECPYYSRNNPPVPLSIGLRYSLLLLFPGTYVAAAGIFALVPLVLKCCPNCRWQERMTRGAGPAEYRPLIQNVDSDSLDSVDKDESDGKGDRGYSSYYSSPLRSPTFSDKSD